MLAAIILQQPGKRRRQGAFVLRPGNPAQIIQAATVAPGLIERIYNLQDTLASDVMKMVVAAG